MTQKPSQFSSLTHALRLQAPAAHVKFGGHPASAAQVLGLQCMSASQNSPVAQEASEAQPGLQIIADSHRQSSMVLCLQIDVGFVA